MACRRLLRAGRGLTWIVTAGLLLPIAGCASFGGTGGKEELRDDVVAIHHFYMRPPWVKAEDGHISGIKPTVYCCAPTSDNPQAGYQGVFVSGPLTFTLEVREPRLDGRGYDDTQVYQWTFTKDEAARYRITKRFTGGRAYGFYLIWPDELDLSGKQVRLVTTYKRADGRPVMHRGPTLLVPGPAIDMRPAVRVSSSTRGEEGQNSERQPEGQR